MTSEGPPETQSEPTSTWKRRLAGFERRFNRRAASPKARKWLLIISLVAFVAISVASYFSLPDDVDFNWWLAIPLILVVTPLTVVANAAEFRVMSTFSGQTSTWAASMRLTLIATAANLLPLPGSILIRTQALRADGVSYKRAIGANAIAGGAWIGVGALATGVLLAIANGIDWISAGLIVVGLAAFTAVMLLIVRVHKTGYLRHFTTFAVVEAVKVAITAVRMAMCFAILGYSINLAQAVALTTPTILAAAVGIFPAGLGLREALAGAIGLAVALPLAPSVAATAVDRVTGQCGLAVMTLGSLLLGFIKRRKPGAETESGADTESDLESEQTVVNPPVQ